MVTHNTCHYKESDKKYIGSNLKTMELLACALIGVCAVIRSNTVCFRGKNKNNYLPGYASYLELCKTHLATSSLLKASNKPTLAATCALFQVGCTRNESHTS